MIYVVDRTFYVKKKSEERKKNPCVFKAAQNLKKKELINKSKLNTNFLHECNVSFLCMLQSK